MFSIVTKSLFVVVLVCAFLSCYEARPEGGDDADGTTPGADTSASVSASGATGSPDDTGATATPDPSAGTASPGDTSSASPLDKVEDAAAAAESERRK
ncbi:unnamed protein product [Larinioides sclopetarius]|uniref:Secreted protein n=1 Tax=Larinioides sclopetarius TaxID=280406 RepID=A0AAV2AJT3_9ARAC